MGRILKDYLTLTKPEITFLVTLSSLAGFLLGSPDGVDGVKMAALLIGVGLTSGGSGTLNHYLERDLDGEMRRTADRPLAAGRIQPLHAWLFGMGLNTAGLILLATAVNLATAALAFATIILYLVVYTPLKRKTVLNTLIGTVPGALPALGGWLGATGSIGAGGLAWFAVLAVWQMPHFLSLAWMYRKDYGRARYAMLPVTAPDGHSTAGQTLLFTVLLLPASLLLWYSGATGALFGVGSFLAGLWFLVPAVRFYRSRSNVDARRVLMGSVQYIPALVALIVLDFFI